jgi:hypothetical protein
MPEDTILRRILEPKKSDKEMEKIPRGASQFMLWIRNERNGGNTNRHEMCWEH